MIAKKILALPLIASMLAISGAGLVNAQVGSPRVAIQLATSGLTSPLVASSTNAVVARLILDTTGSTEPVRISSLPFVLTTGGGASASTLNSCALYNEASPTTALTATSTAVAGTNTISFATPLTLAANTVTVLALRCDVGAGLAAGGTFTYSMNTASVSAVGAVTGLPALVTVRGAVTPPVTPPLTPGVPSTGGEPHSDTLTIVLGSLMALALGAGLLKKRQAERI